MAGTAIEDGYVAVPTGVRDPVTGTFDDADWVRVPAEHADQWDARQWSSEPPGALPA